MRGKFLFIATSDWGKSFVGLEQLQQYLAAYVWSAYLRDHYLGPTPNKGINPTAYSKLFQRCIEIFAMKRLAVICRLSQR